MLRSVHAIWGSASTPTAQHRRRRPRIFGTAASADGYRGCGCSTACGKPFGAGERVHGGRRGAVEHGRKGDRTGAYLRSVAALCAVAAHLLRAEAAALNADTEQVSAHRVAAQHRCDLIAEDVIDRLGVDDPIGGPLLEVVEDAKSFDAGSSTAPLLEMWARLPLPVPVVVGTETDPIRSQGRPCGDPTSGRAGRDAGRGRVGVAGWKADHRPRGPA